MLTVSSLCRRILAFLSVAFGAAEGAHAYTFEPTDSEFNAWPRYCKARYVSTMIGQSSRFVSQVDSSMQAAAENALSAPTYLHIHHYCAGLSHFARARLEPNLERRRYLLDEARAEMLFSLRSDPKTGPFYSTMIVNLALVERERGEPAAARELLEGAIVSHPADARLYLGLAIILRSQKELNQARAVLETGLKSIDQESLELNYNLGLVCFELADYDCALRQARIAYAGGYPFPALKDRLAGRGLWEE